MAYLIHFNKNHSKANGQFTSGDGDGDGISNDHANQKKYVKNPWGVRKKFQNKDGTLTELGKKNLEAYETDNKNLKAARKEAYKLFKQSRKLKNDFGGEWDSIDDDDFFSETAKEYGLDTKAYDRAMKVRNDFKDNNKKYISNGLKMVTKMQDIDPSRWDRVYRGSEYDSARIGLVFSAVLGLPINTVVGVVNTVTEKANYDRYKFLDEQK